MPSRVPQTNSRLVFCSATHDLLAHFSQIIARTHTQFSHSYANLLQLCGHPRTLSNYFSYTTKPRCRRCLARISRPLTTIYRSSREHFLVARTDRSPTQESARARVVDVSFTTRFTKALPYSIRSLQFTLHTTIYNSPHSLFTILLETNCGSPQKNERISRSLAIHFAHVCT